MRPQEQAILDAVHGRVFHVETPFLTNADCVEAVRLAAGLLGGPLATQGSFSSARLKTWTARGLFKPWTRNPDLRNNLYSALDVVRLATMQNLSEAGGVELQTCAGIAEAVITVLTGPGFELMDEEPTSRPILVFFERGDDSHVIETRIMLPRFKGKAFQGEPRTAASLMEKTKAAMVWSIDWARFSRSGVAVAQTVWREKVEKILARAGKR
jgi:hypothetical protein